MSDGSPAWVGEAAKNRRRMLERAYADPGALHRLQVHVPDQPGVLADITQAFGAEQINIEDFELQHISPELGGTLTLLVTGENLLGGQLGEPDNATIRPGRTITAGLRAGF